MNMFIEPKLKGKVFKPAKDANYFIENTRNYFLNETHKTSLKITRLGENKDEAA